jgi:hypothetical protein
MEEFENTPNAEGFSKEEISWTMRQYVEKKQKEDSELNQRPTKDALDPQTWEFFGHPGEDEVFFRKKLPNASQLMPGSNYYQVVITGWPELVSSKQIDSFVETQLNKDPGYKSSLLAIEICHYSPNNWVARYTVKLEFDSAPIAGAFKFEVEGRFLQNLQSESSQNRGLHVEIRSLISKYAPASSNGSQRSISVNSARSGRSGRSRITEHYLDNGMMFQPEDSVYIPWLREDIDHENLYHALQIYGKVLSMKLLPKEYTPQRPPRNTGKPSITTFQSWVKFGDREAKDRCLKSRIELENRQLYQLFEPSCIRHGLHFFIREYIYIDQATDLVDEDFTPRSGRQSSRVRELIPSISSNLGRTSTNKLDWTTPDDTPTISESMRVTESLSTAPSTSKISRDSSSDKISITGGLQVPNSAPKILDMSEKNQSMNEQKGILPKSTSAHFIVNPADMPTPSAFKDPNYHEQFGLDRVPEAAEQRLQQLEKVAFEDLESNSIAPFEELEQQSSHNKNRISMSDDTRDKTRTRSNCREERSTSREPENTTFLSANDQTYLNSSHLLSASLTGAVSENTKDHIVSDESAVAQISTQKLGQLLYNSLKQVGIFTGPDREKVLDVAVGFILAADTQDDIIAMINDISMLRSTALEVYNEARLYLDQMK